MAWAASAVNAQVAAENQTDHSAAYSVHEWGVFTVPRGADWLMQDMIREWQGFPDFFHGVMPERDLLYRGPVTKPVLFFHGDAKIPVSLSIQFATGRPLIWWPPVEHPATGAFGNTLPAALGDVDPKSVIRFQMQLNSDVGRRPPVDQDHWVNELRRVDAISISVEDSSSQLRGPDENRVMESFVYYDGLMKSPAPPVVRRTTNTGITIESNSDHPWLDALILQRSLDGHSLSWAWIDRLDSGSQQLDVELNSIAPDELTSLIDRFRQSLVAAGLNEDEAGSLINVWQNGLFERSGLSIVYRIPPDTYDRWIPLHFDPQPAETVRVGLVVHQHLEPELDETVAALIDDLGSNQFEIRQRADRQLHEIGGAAIAAIRRATTSGDSETAARALLLLRNLDTAELLEQLMRDHDPAKKPAGVEFK